jgi:hypothetical protein
MARGKIHIDGVRTDTDGDSGRPETIPADGDYIAAIYVVKRYGAALGNAFYVSVQVGRDIAETGVCAGDCNVQDGCLRSGGGYQTGFGLWGRRGSGGLFLLSPSRQLFQK